MAGAKIPFFRWLAISVCGACSEGGARTPSNQPGKAQLTATLSEGTLPGVFPATLAIDPTLSIHEVSAAVGEGDAVWWFNAAVPQEGVVARSASLPLGGQEVGVGRGTGLRASSGSLRLDFAPAQISGSATTDSTALDASFGGVLSVSCVVPRSHLSGVSAADGTEGDGEPMVEDTMFETSLCNPYKALAGK